MKNLQLSLINKWFQMTKEPDLSKRKLEDYRDLTEYWIKRLVEMPDKSEEVDCHDFITALMNPIRNHGSVGEMMKYWGVKFRPFDYNIMTLGYPKGEDTSRILKLEHKGIEIRTGRSDWGAVEGKLYFVIKHGEIL